MKNPINFKRWPVSYYIVLFYILIREINQRKGESFLSQWDLYVTLFYIGLVSLYHLPIITKKNKTAFGKEDLERKLSIVTFHQSPILMTGVAFLVHLFFSRPWNFF